MKDFRHGRSLRRRANPYNPYYKHFGRNNYNSDYSQDRYQNRRFESPQNWERRNSNRPVRNNQPEKYTYQNNNYKGPLPKEIREMTKSMDKVHSFIHHTENWRNNNPWERKVENLIQQIRLPGGPISSESLEEIRKSGKVWAENVKHTILNELQAKLEAQQNINVQMGKSGKITEEALTIATNITQKRSLEKYGKKLNGTNLLAAVDLVSKDTGIAIQQETRKNIVELAKNQNIEGINRKSTTFTRHGKNPYENEMRQIRKDIDELAQIMKSFNGLAEELHQRELNCCQGNNQSRRENPTC